MAMRYSETVKKAAQNYYEMLGLALTRKVSGIPILTTGVPTWKDLPEEARDAHYQAAELALGKAQAPDAGHDALREAARRYLDRDMPPGRRLAVMRAFSYVLQYVGAQDIFYEQIGAAEGAAAPDPGYPELAKMVVRPHRRGQIFKAVEHLMANSGCPDQELGRIADGLPFCVPEQHTKIGAEVRSWLHRIWPGDDEDQRRMNGAMASALAGRSGAAAVATPLSALIGIRGACEALLNGDPGPEVEAAVCKIARAAGGALEVVPGAPARAAEPARVLVRTNGHSSDCAGAAP